MRILSSSRVCESWLTGPFEVSTFQSPFETSLEPHIKTFDALNSDVSLESLVKYAALTCVHTYIASISESFNLRKWLRRESERAPKEVLLSSRTSSRKLL